MKLSPNYITAFVVGSVIGIVPAWLMAQLIELIPSLEPEGLGVVSEFMSDGFGLEQVIFVLLVVLAVPALEELLFRKWIWLVLSWKMSSYWTWIVVSILFALLHMEPIHIIGLLPLSFFVGWLRFRTGKIRYSIVAHMANNAMACLLAVA
jgi:membrane protease YdiL (CAAX protease family)